MAGISLVMGITGILTSFLAIGAIPSAIGLVLGLAARNKNKKSTAGIITSAIGLILSVIFIVSFSHILKKGGVTELLTKQGAEQAVGVIINEYNTPPEEMGMPEETQFNPHRGDAVLLSNKSFDIITAQPVIERINGAGTDLYYCVVNTSESLPEYIYSYYDKHFLTADEKHALINISDNTVSEIECVGEYLRVAVHVYSPGSETSADSVFSGDTLQVYRVYIDNTDIVVE